MATVIKAAGDAQLPRKLRALDLIDHLAEARAVVEQVRGEAREWLADARREAVAIREEAHRVASQEGQERGYAEGLARGHAEGLQRSFDEAAQRFRTEQAQLVGALTTVLAEFERRKDELLVEARRDVLELAVALARKLTFDVGRLNREAACANYERAIKLAAATTDVHVRIHPDDEATLRRFAAELAEKLAAGTNVSFQTDPSLAPGGCVVRVGNGDTACEVDASLESQIAQITEQLLAGSREA